MQRIGVHGFPLIGTGDWNDGMDRVGVEGRGESVWLAWFQIAVVRDFAPIATQLGQGERVLRWENYASELKLAIDDAAWDGEWFVRAFDDAGEPLGSAQNTECQIDSISQSWGVLAGFGEQPRVQTAMASARHHLINTAGQRQALPLLDPPFNRSGSDPGYIGAYPPGVRENGGQYNHAAAWLGMAAAGLGDGELAWQVFEAINPILRTLDTQSSRQYEREPYVLVGDVSTQDDNAGRGGWSWYTGSASWTWQLGMQSLLGLTPVAGAFLLNPCLPPHWGWAEVTIGGDQGVIRLRIEDPDNVGHGRLSLTIDGHAVEGGRIPLPGAGAESQVVARLSALQDASGPDRPD
jgi:cyclic beta-1,2-glucan synthetase